MNSFVFLQFIFLSWWELLSFTLTHSHTRNTSIINCSHRVAREVLWLTDFITEVCTFWCSFTNFIHVRTPASVSQQSVLCIDGLGLVGLCGCLFWESTQSEIVWYLSFSAWLTSLWITPTRSIHVVANGKILFYFLLLNNGPHCLYSFMHQWILRCFHILAVAQ